MNKYLLYRITSKANQKPRINGFSKFDCLDSLLHAFPGYKVICIADNCDTFTHDLLKKQSFHKFIKTNLGNAASFRHLLNQELDLLQDDDLVYFAEDDYLYRGRADQILEEGLQYFDYVTLYDHPDKYGTNPLELNLLVPKGKLSEYTQIIKGRMSLWRTTNSTTMTFGCFVSTIRKDRFIWNLFTRGFKIPRDFYTWILLTCPTKFFFRPKRNFSIVILLSLLLYVLRGRRTLGVPFPSVSAHLEVGMVPDNFESSFPRKI